jgi:hypothetical protein
MSSNSTTEDLVLQNHSEVLRMLAREYGRTWTGVHDRMLQGALEVFTENRGASLKMLEATAEWCRLQGFTAAAAKLQNHAEGLALQPAGAP